MAQVLQTARLNIREIDESDAPFILELLTDPSFLENIGDRGVSDLASAVNYIRTGPGDSYARNGYGLWLVELKDSRIPVGTCGIIRRDTLPAADIGYAFLPRHWGQGYALEACQAVRDHALRTLAMPQLLAIVAPGNNASIKVLERIGFNFRDTVQLTADAEQVKLYAVQA
ncbi:GNAT family N-acetyltransferase [Lysobacter sp. TAF61]|uniref:GNAT family N-acetyltransferase n=1 Tax=Lysobacter sp. TAF61 TaxID=3233072 RepID=UPI003F9E02AD